eukprot:4186124-Pyramimonas_sp.AAC.2
MGQACLCRLGSGQNATACGRHPQHRRSSLCCGWRQGPHVVRSRTAYNKGSQPWIGSVFDGSELCGGMSLRGCT